MEGKNTEQNVWIMISENENERGKMMKKLLH